MAETYFIRAGDSHWHGQPCNGFWTCDPMWQGFPREFHDFTFAIFA